MPTTPPANVSDSLCAKIRVDTGSKLPATAGIDVNHTGIARTFEIQEGKFAGRLAGGALRSQIRGANGYGSGYPLSATSALRGNFSGPVEGLDLPYLFWPVSWAQAGAEFEDYYGSREYEDDERRLGGRMTQYTLKTTHGFGLDSNFTKLAFYTDAHTADSLLASLSTVSPPSATGLEPNCELATCVQLKSFVELEQPSRALTGRSRSLPSKDVPLNTVLFPRHELLHSSSTSGRILARILRRASARRVRQWSATEPDAQHRRRRKEHFYDAESLHRLSREDQHEAGASYDGLLG